MSCTRSLSIFIASIAAIVLTACGPGRTPIPPGEIPQPPAVSAEDEDYGQQVLSELTKKYPLERNDSYINRVRDIVAKLALAAHADREPWHVYVLKGDDTINAAATRGNYVFVWTGMLKTAMTDGELATVLAHELGHVLAGHTLPTPEEEASSILAEASGQVVSGVLNQLGGAYGILGGLAGALVSSAIQAMVVNPGSRRLESEADQIGFYLMADAGYDPRDAIELWTKMENDPRTRNETSLQFLSTHPATADRLEALKAMLPDALDRYERSKHPNRQGGKSTNKSSGGPTGNGSKNQSGPHSKRHPNTGSSPGGAQPQGDPNGIDPGDTFAIPDAATMPANNPAAAPGSGTQTTTSPVQSAPNSGLGLQASQTSPTTTKNDSKGQWWTVAESTSTIHTDATKNSPSVASLKKGERVLVMYRTGRWYHVSAPATGFVEGVDLTPPSQR